LANAAEFYIGKQGLDSTFGAASSSVVLLVWVYYSAQIVLYAAEFTCIYATRYGARRGSLKEPSRPERVVSTS
jgi:membrane protein